MYTIIIVVLQSKKELVMVKNFITAEQARNLTDNSEKVFNTMFKCIKEMAENGYSQCEFCTDRMDESVRQKLIKKAQLAGFTVSDLTSTRVDGEKDIFGILLKW